MELQNPEQISCNFKHLIEYIFLKPSCIFLTTHIKTIIIWGAPNLSYNFIIHYDLIALVLIDSTQKLS